MLDGDCTGYWSARTVLTAPEVEVAVLETARGGVLKRGLAFDRCDIGIVLNLAGDHLGQDGIETAEQLAKVKGLVVETAHKAVVLNADDAACAGLAARAPRSTEVVYFGFDARGRVLAEHLKRGGRCVFEREGMLVWADGAHHTPLVASAQLPCTLGGRARHNIANAMAAAAALLVLGLPRDRVAAGLVSFTSNESQNPLRLNFYRSRGVTLLVDYAHNAAAYEAVIATARQLVEGRLIGVVSVPGDRRPEDLEAIGRICGAGFDGLVVYEMDDARGRPAGVTAERIVAGAAAARQATAETVTTVLDVREAIRHALRGAEPGDLIVIGCASHLSELRQALAGSDLIPVDGSALAAGAGSAEDDVEAQPPPLPALAANGRFGFDRRGGDPIVARPGR